MFIDLISKDKMEKKQRFVSALQAKQFAAFVGFKIPQASLAFRFFSDGVVNDESDDDVQEPVKQPVENEEMQEFDDEQEEEEDEDPLVKIQRN